VVSACIDAAAAGSTFAIGVVDPNKQNSVSDLESGVQTAVERVLYSTYPFVEFQGKHSSGSETIRGAPFVAKPPVHKELKKYPVPPQLAWLDRSQVTFWVDPLDGTQEDATEGNLAQMHILIGVAYKGTPIAAVQRTVGGDARCVWAVVGGGVPAVSLIGRHQTHPPSCAMRGLDHSPDQHCTQEQPSELTAVLAVASRRLQDADLAKARRIFRGQDGYQVSAGGGFGSSTLKVLEGGHALYGQGNLWNMCAIEALVTAAGGALTDLEGQRFWYHKEAERQLNHQVVACMPHLYTALKKVLWRTISSHHVDDSIIPH